MNAKKPEQPNAEAAKVTQKPQKIPFLWMSLCGFCVSFAASAFGSSVSNPHKGPSA